MKSVIAILISVGIACSTASALTSTRTALSATPSAPVFGGVLTLTATVLPGSPTGNVTFYDGTRVLGTAPVANSTATLTTTSLQPGTHSLIAVYGGDSNNSLSVSSKVAVVLSDTAGGSFNPLTPVAASSPSLVVAADVNGDNNVDLLALSTAGNSVTVLLSNGAASFEPASGSPVAVGTGPTSFAVADVNGDGKPDLVSVNQGTGNLGVNLGNGDGTFQTAVQYPCGSTPGSLAVADFNGDGFPDVAVTNIGNRQITLLLNDKAGAFNQSSTPITLAEVPSSIAVGDYNRDGKADVAITNFGDGSNFVSIFLGVGDGTFQPASMRDISVGASPGALIAVDLNNDSKSDLVIVNSAGSSLTVLLGFGDGSFQAALPLSVGTNPSGLVASDFNGDLKPDLALLNTVDGTSTLSLFYGNGDGTFQVAGHFAFGSNPGSVVAANLNNDSKVDLAVTNAGTSEVQPLLGVAGSVTTLSVGPNPAGVGQTVTMTATVLPSSATGTVTFLDGTTPLGTANITNGAAVFTTTSLALGPHQLSASYAGTTQIAGSTSNVVTESIRPGSTTSLAATPATVGLGQVVTLTATVTTTSGSPPTGNVTFYYGSTVIATRPVVSATATVGTKLLPAGTLGLTARYGGDSTDLPSISASVSVQVNAAPAGGFASPVGIATGLGSTAAIESDFNDDGTADLAVVNYSGTAGGIGGVSILVGNAQGSFSSVNTLTAGTNPVAIGTGDFNGDGQADLVVSNYSSSNISVFLGHGNGTFASAVNIAIGAFPYGVAVADFNGDGKSDIAVAVSGTNQAVVLLGNGDGTFQTPAHYTVGAGLKALTAGDFNRDGVPDLAIAGGTGVFVLIGKGDGTFAAPVPYTAGTGPTSVITADLANDGKLDLIIVNSLSDSISVLSGNGDGTFQTAAFYAVGNFPQFAVAGDFNGDGKSDVAVANEGSNNISVLYGSGDGSLRTALTFLGGSTPTSLVAGAFDPTGRADLAVTNYQTGTLSVLLALQTANVVLSASPNPDPSGLSVTLTANVTPGNATGTVTFYSGQTSLGSATISGGAATLGNLAFPPGNQTFTATYSGDANYGSVTSAAVTDLVGLASTTTTLAVTPNPAALGQAVALSATVTNAVSTGIVTFYDGASIIGETPLSNGTASLSTVLLPAGVRSLTARYAGFGGIAGSVSAPVNISITTQFGYGLSVAQSYGTSTPPTSIVASDFNGDGKIDLAVANASVGVLIGNGDGTFQPVANYPAGTNPVQILAADLNADGKQDLVIANNQTNNISVLLGNGDGTFGTTVNYPAGATPTSIAIADFNNDGVPDIAAVSSAGGATILLGHNDGTFAAPVPVTVGVANAFVAAADFDGDGNADLAIADSNGPVWLLLGKGDGTFNPSVSYQAGTTPASLVIGDFNGDGHPDVAVANKGSANVSVFLNAGHGTLRQPAGVYGAGTSPQFVSASDFNGDGHLDLIAADAGGPLDVLFGNGDGSFQTAVSVGSGSNPLSLAVSNFNGDGRAHVAVANQASTNVSILLDTPLLLTASAGTPQSASAGVTFAAPLTVTATAFGVPAAGVKVVFTAPASGASGVFAGAGPSVTVTTGADGKATAPVFTANATTGNYQVVASVGTINAPFSLTNVGSGCTFTVSPGPLSFGGAGGSPVFSVLASGTSCAWSVSSDSTWLTVQTASGTGNGTVPLVVPPNTTGFSRTANLQIAGQILTVTERTTTQAFADVPPSAYYFDAVNAIKQDGLTTGCAASPPQYCPGLTVTRAEMAVFLVRSVYHGDHFTASSTPYFADVPAGSFGFQWVQKLFELGITTGCGGGNFCPNLAVTRDQMAVFLIRSRLGTTTPFPFSATPLFQDVPANYWAFSFIQRLKQDQITNGCSATTFCPGSPVTRGDMAIFLARTGYNQQMPPNYPVISAISETAIARGSTISVTITGMNTNWNSSTTVYVTAGVSVASVTVNSPTSITAQLTAAGNAGPQPVSVVAVTDQELDVLPNGLTVQ